MIYHQFLSNRSSRYNRENVKTEFQIYINGIFSNLCQCLRYNMIYRFVIFEAIERVITIKNPSKQNFNCFIVLLIVLAYQVRFMHVSEIFWRFIKSCKYSR